MKPALWRTAALLLIALAVAFVAYQLTLPDSDDFGLHFQTPLGTAGTVRIGSVDAGSPAQAAGIRAGDTVNYGNNQLDRAKVVYASAGSHVIVTVNGNRRVTFTVRRMPQRPIPWTAFVIRLAFLLVAGLLAWRRPADPAARALVAFLWCFGLSIAMSNGVLPTPLLSLIVLKIVYLALFYLGMGAAATFAARFPSGTPQPLPRVLAAVATLFSIAAAAAVGPAVLFVRNARLAPQLNAAFLFAFVALGLLVVATLAVAYAQGAASERQRRRWVFLLLGLCLAGPIVDVIIQSTFGFQQWVDTLTLLPLGVLPFGLAYVILRHRVIDVGFVLNRAVVYTGVSIVVVAVFVIVESLLSKYVEQTSHIGSIATQLFVALILGFSVRAIHTRVDRFVDAVLFRERHLAETAIRFFAHDASYITDADVLVTRCVKTIERYAYARGAGVWTAQSPTYAAAASTFEASPSVGENDPAIVAMRARRAIVELRGTESDLPGALAFPMIVRGELLGVLLCGPKTDDEIYAPDERDALAGLATSVGHALDAIEVRELRRRLAQTQP